MIIDMHAHTSGVSRCCRVDYKTILVQAHPLRYGEDLLHPAFLDGVEVSCHPKYTSAYLEKLSLFAREHRLILTCGGDYHGDTRYRPICGTYLPEAVENSVEIVEYFKRANTLRLRVHEVGEKTFEDKEYKL